MAFPASVSAHATLDPEDSRWRVEPASLGAWSSESSPVIAEHVHAFELGPDGRVSPERVPSTGRACPEGCEHRRHFQPGVPGFHIPVSCVTCIRPKVLVCSVGGGFVVLPCDSASPLRRGRSLMVCGPCAERYRRRVQQVAKTPAILAKPGHLVFATFTAPGLDQHCKKPGCKSTRCRHEKCPCTPPGGVDVASWNGEQGWRWNRLWQEISRLLASRGVSAQYFRGVEDQARGALHVHLLMVLDRPLLIDAELRRQVRQKAIRWGWGHEMDLRTTVPPSAVVLGSGDKSPALVAWYVSKYVGKAVSMRPLIPWRQSRAPVAPEPEQVLVDEPTGEVLEYDPGSPGRRGSPLSFRSWTTSRAWGCSMGQVRQLQSQWWADQLAAAWRMEDALLYGSDDEAGCALGLAGCEAPPPP
jgi:hypothetical protein